MPPTSIRAARLELFLPSFLAFYYELVVIRWLASEVRVFAYFKNLPLLASFLGLGVGCALAGRRPRLTAWFPVLLALLVGLCAYADALDIAHLPFPGVLSLSFTADGGAWIGHRLLKTLREASGHEPLVVHNGRDFGLTFFAGPGVEKARLAAIPAVTEWKAAPTDGVTVRPATDDWPFPHMKPQACPTAYLVVLAMILAGAAVLVRLSLPGVASGPADREARPAFHPAMFFLGAAFMLVEVKSIAKLSVLFGSTWPVNSAVFSGILVMILGPNRIVAGWRPADVRPWFGLLWASLSLAYFVPAAALTGLQFAARATVGALMVSLPILFAGVIFARAFAAIGLPSAALGSNLFGALVGGTLEYLSMLLGIRALSLVALTLYAGAFRALRGLRSQYKIIKA